MKKVLLGFVLVWVAFSCANNSEEDPVPQEDLIVNDFKAFVENGRTQSSSIGFIDASTTTGELSFTLVSQNPVGAIDVNVETGEILVADEQSFLFENNQKITGSVEVSSGENTETISIDISINDPGGPSFDIWTGSSLTFTKQDGADPTNESNQDRITDNVWITRGNNGGQIYNIKVETSSNKSASPSDTEWARGTTDNIANLNFAPFRDAVNPQDVVGIDLVLHLITDDIYIDIKFLSWSQGRQGGFSYERSTE